MFSDGSTGRNLEVCGGRKRESHVYVSETHKLEIRLTTRRFNFLIKFESKKLVISNRLQVLISCIQESPGSLVAVNAEIRVHTEKDQFQLPTDLFLGLMVHKICKNSHLRRGGTLVPCLCMLGGSWWRGKKTNVSCENHDSCHAVFLCSVIGCPDISQPPNAYIKRNNNQVTIGCLSSTDKVFPHSLP